MEVPGYIKQKNRGEKEIQKAGAILEEKNTDIQTIEEYKKLKNELKKYGLSIENPRRFASILQTIDQIGYNPRKIVRELARLKSLRQAERRLKNNCKIWQSPRSSIQGNNSSMRTFNLELGFLNWLRFMLLFLRRPIWKICPMVRQPML